MQETDWMVKLNVSGQSERVFEALLEAGESDVVSRPEGTLTAGHAIYGFVVSWSYESILYWNDRTAPGSGRSCCTTAGATYRYA